MTWGTMQVGALLLKETDILEDVTNANTGERTVRWEGAETAPSAATQADIAARQADIMGLIDRILPVQFERKTEYNGFYLFTDTNTTLEKWQQGPAQVRWGLAAQYLGPDNVVDLESRLANVVRLNDFGLTGERWHAPAAGHSGYYVGAVSPAQVVRQAETGPITVYRAIPAGVNPRWGATVAGYQQGRVRFLSSGVERVSPRIPCGVTTWELNNGLVRIRPNASAGLATTLLIAIWDGFVWRERAWDVRISGFPLVPPTDFVSLTVTRLDPEVASVRIVARQPDNGQRVLLDLLLRRGSRILEGYVQRTVSGQISVQLDVAETWVDNVNYASAEGEGSDSLRWAAGSSKFFSLATNGGVSLSTSASLDFWLGAEVASGDLASPASFESGVGNWTATGGSFTQASDQVKLGSFSGKLVVAGSPALAYVRNYVNVAPVVPGTRYRVSFWARSLDGADVSAAIDWQNGSGTYVSTDAATTTLLGGVWRFMDYETPPAPAGAAQAVYGPTLNGNPPNGETLWVDHIRFRTLTEPGDKAADLVQQYIGAMAEKVGVTRR